MEFGAAFQLDGFECTSEIFVQEFPKTDRIEQSNRLHLMRKNRVVFNSFANYAATDA